MERESNQIQPNCRSGCGFYGNPATDGLCSICHKEALKKKQQVPTTPSSHCSALAMASTTPNHLNPLSSHADFDVVDSMSQSHLPKKKTSKVLTNISSSNTIGGSRTSINASLHSIQDVPEVQEVVVPTLALVNQAAEQAAAGTTDASPLPGEASPASSADSDTGEDKDGDKDKKKKNRCAVCRKKVGLTGFQCRCGGLFCAVHRYSDKHDCSFNYREMGAQEIRRNNPVVVGEKIQKI